MKRNELPKIPKTKYIYHTFNKDYIEKNIQPAGFDRDGNIEGYIVGEGNIDTKDLEDEIKKIEADIAQKTELVRESIDSYKDQHFSSIPHISAIKEYGYINKDDIIKETYKSSSNHQKEINELIKDYYKVNSIPTDLESIDEIDEIDIDFKSIDYVIKTLSEEFNLSSFEESFRKEILIKFDFVKTGIQLYEQSKSENCPFCKQTLLENAQVLIKSYTTFINDSEFKIIDELRKMLRYLKDTQSLMLKISDSYISSTNLFEEYKMEYILSLENNKPPFLKVSDINDHISKLVNCITDKIENISKPISIDKNYKKVLQKLQNEANKVIKGGNRQIGSMNKIISKNESEARLVRRKMCIQGYVDLINKHKDDIQEIKKMREQEEIKSIELSEKKMGERVDKREMVYDTIKLVLSYFFNDKYTLNKDDFLLELNSRKLGKAQAKDVLSEGEKNIVAFAYYIGDIHTKVNSKSDYNRLFFIIDDPISSMDFNHGYTISSVIQRLKELINKNEKLNVKNIMCILFTHNMEFMRILYSNRIIKKAYVLRDSKMSILNHGINIPYLNHLMDIYKVARREESPSHTTGNSIRHVIETLNKFKNVDMDNYNIDKYIKEEISKDIHISKLMHDMSHGAFRTEQPVFSPKQYKDVCEKLIAHIENKYNGQIKHCENRKT